MPVFLRAGHWPIRATDRKAVIDCWSRRLAKVPGLPITNWRVDDLSWSGDDPASTVRRRVVRMIGDLEEPYPAEITKTHFKAYEDVLEVRGGGPGAGQFVYDDLQIGCLEFSTDLVARDGHPITIALQDGEAWRNWAAARIDMIDGRKLKVQAEWPKLRRALVETMDPAIRFPALDRLRSGGQVERDDTCDVYGHVIILAHRPGASLAAVRDDVEKIAAASGSGVIAIGTDDFLRRHQITSLFAHDYGVVVSCEGNLDESRTVKRVVALARQFWMSYAGVMVASEGLQAQIGASVKANGGLWSEHSLREEAENLTRITGILAMIRFDAMPENYVADDLESTLYGRVFVHWKIDGDIALLDRSIEDAVRVVDGLATRATQRSEVWISAVLAFIAGLTLASVLKDSADFLFDSYSGPLRLTDRGLFIGAIILLTAVWIGWQMGAIRNIWRWIRR
ncbi:hypothetical protein L1787_00175 [Acuticoccus sp. M5D2P5]|uniref:hypothetical protein n=1 Tax=Acuticoccus kalidii TaxID=2910977 RepID=UPI001F2052F1|nr:hypothetical protein [Acuticoccus kalidii]MCF3931826.1 hypothetical protein [Acuticoccus kalidii]